MGCCSLITFLLLAVLLLFVLDHFVIDKNIERWISGLWNKTSSPVARRSIEIADLAAIAGGQTSAGLIADAVSIHFHKQITNQFYLLLCVVKNLDYRSKKCGGFSIQWKQHASEKGWRYACN